MKTKRFSALALCIVMILVSFGIIAGAVETEPTINTVTTPLQNGGLIAQIAQQSNVQSGATSVSFTAGQAGTVKITVGVPETGFYNVAALLVAGDNSSALDSDLKVTTEFGESFTYSKTTNGSSWTYAPYNVYLERGDKILTFGSAASGSKGIVMSGVRLYNITAAFLPQDNVSFEVPAGSKKVTVTAGEVFAPNIGAGDINSEKVVLEAPGATVVRNRSDWTKTTMTFPEVGEYTVSISDDVFGNTVTATIAVTKKFTGDTTEKVPTMDTVAEPLKEAAFVAQVTSLTNAQKDSTSVYFTANKSNTVKVKVGVPTTGYYNIAALLRDSTGEAKLYNDLTVTTDLGESFTYSRTTRGGSWTYAPVNVYLVRGDRILTFTSDMTSGRQTVMNGVRLYNITKAFYALQNLAFEIPAASDSVTVTAGKLFATEIGVTDVDSSKVVITATGAKTVKDSSDWSRSTITFSAEGEYTVTIKDGFYGGVRTATVTVTKSTEEVPDPEEPDPEEPDPEEPDPDTETEPTINTVNSPAIDAAFTALITSTKNVTKGSTNATFTAGQAGTMKIKVGVPETGYYNVSALVTASDTTTNLNSDLKLTTDRGDSFTYSRTTRGGSWTYAPANVYLVKGDRILTFSTDTTGSKGILMRGIRLYHITHAFAPVSGVSYEIPAGAESITATVGELFEQYIGTNIDSSKVVLTAPGATVSADLSDWKKSKITFTEEGEYIVTITEDVYGGVASILIPVTKIVVVEPDGTETEPTMDTVEKPLMWAEMVAQVTELTNAQIKESRMVSFTANKDNTVKVKVGVPETGYYNVAALLTDSTGEAKLYNDMILTTDRGESFTYSRTTRGASWTYAPANVYLAKGDRILTFSSNMTSGKQSILSGIRLYNIKKAFYALSSNLSFEIPSGSDSVTVTAGEMFATEIGVTGVDSSKVVLTTVGATVNADSSDWTKSTITFTAGGKYSVAIKDGFYGNATIATITITKK